MSQTSMKLVVGHDSGEFYINRFAGVNPVNGDALWYTRDGELTNEMRDEDKVLVGKSMTAPWIGGFGTNISWKGLSLSAQFSWVADRWMINNDRYFDESNGRYSSYNQPRRLLDRWKEPGDVTDIPRHGVYTEFDDRLLEDASFLRLKNVMLSYSLPSELLSRSRFISGIRIYAQAQNLFTITGFSGLDPEGEAMQTFSDAEQVVTGIYAGLKSSALFSGSLTVMPDIQADLVYAVENFTNVYGSVWQWDILSTDSDVESVYAALYTIIARCNFYLESIDEVMANELDVTNLGYLETYTGEVYTIRALCYSKLLECFCKAYDPATAENELGVVLRTKYSEPEPMKRASLKDSYDLVIDDLEHAEEYLDNDFDQYNSIYVTAAAAQALHARVALYMQDWQTAIDYATMLIENDAFELADGTKSYSSTDTYLTYMWNYDSSYEIIWELGFMTTSYGGALGQVFLNADRDYMYTYPDYVPAQWVLDAYTDNDLLGCRIHHVYRHAVDRHGISGRGVFHRTRSVDRGVRLRPYHRSGGDRPWQQRHRGLSLPSALEYGHHQGG